MFLVTRSDRRIIFIAPWLALWASACSGTKDDVRNHQSEEDRSDQTTAGAESGAAIAPTQQATESDATHQVVAPHPPSVQLDSCTAESWTNPAEEKREMECRQHWDDSGADPHLRYVCSCDVNACPLYVIVGQQTDSPATAQLNDCVIDVPESQCDDALLANCGATRGRTGFCETEYYGLTPTRATQEPPDAFTVVCFEQSDGTHACQCPNETALVATTETDCNRALLTACPAPCESEAGQCIPKEEGYACECTAGFNRAVGSGLCEYALFRACEPQCSNEEGACYWDPSGGPNITCRCNGDAEPRVLVRDPDVEGDECRTPLVETCGGSSEGPTAWP